MDKKALAKYGITGVKEILYNPSYEVLYNEETKPGLEGYDKGQVTELGAINVMTGVYTGRSPKDKYIVMDKNSKNTVWWNSPEYPNDNHEMSQKGLERGQETRPEAAQRQAPIRSGRLLRNSHRHPHEGSLHHGGCMAGTFRYQHVHPSPEPERVRPGA